MILDEEITDSGVFDCHLGLIALILLLKPTQMVNTVIYFYHQGGILYQGAPNIPMKNPNNKNNKFDFKFDEIPYYENLYNILRKTGSRSFPLTWQ